jgi:hypothetical protein
MIASRLNQKQKKLPGSWTYLSMVRKFAEHVVLAHLWHYRMVYLEYFADVKFFL